MSVPAILAGSLARSVGPIPTTDLHGGALIAPTLATLVKEAEF